MFEHLFPSGMSLAARLFLVLAPLAGLIGLVVWWAALDGLRGKKYIDRFLQSGEHVEYEARLHPIVYFPGILLLAFSVAGFVVVGGTTEDFSTILVWTAIFGVVLLFTAWLQQRTTEIAITDRRVIYKSGIIRRETIEMNRRQIESIDVSQSILGRLLNFGTVTIRGTGAGIEPIRQIEAPLTFRGFLVAQ